MMKSCGPKSNVERQDLSLMKMKGYSMPSTQHGRFQNRCDLPTNSLGLDVTAVCSVGFKKKLSLTPLSH